MSLIADSLKKAVKEKSPPRMDSGLGINVVPKSVLSRHPGFMTATRFSLLVILPTAILFYLISTGAFDLRKPVAPEKIATPKPIQVEKPAPAPSKSIPSAVKRETAPVKAAKPAIKKPVKVPPVETRKSPAVKAQPVLQKKVLQSKEVKQAMPPREIKKEAALVAPDTQVRPMEKEGTTIEQLIPQSPIPVQKAPDRSQKLTIDLKTKGEEVASLPPADGKADIVTTAPGGKDDVFENSNYFFNRGLFFQQAKEWEKALANYSKAEQLNPDNADTYNNKGVVYKEMGQFDRAIDEFLRAVFLNPQYAKAFNNIGVVYYMQKNYQEAIKNYQKAIDLNPENLEAFNNLAIVYKNKNEFEKARAVLNQALSMNPDHPGTNYNLAVLYEESKEITPALHYYRRFVELGSVNYPSLVFEVKKHIQTLESR